MTQALHSKNYSVIDGSDEAAIANLLSFKVLDKHLRRANALERRYMKLSSTLVGNDSSLDATKM